MEELTAFQTNHSLSNVISKPIVCKTPDHLILNQKVRKNFSDRQVAF